MRGIALALAAAAAGSLPAGSLAEPPARKAAPTLKGELESGGTVAFELNRSKSGERKVVQWRWRNLPITCLNGKHEFDGDFRRPWLDVSENRTFYGRAEPAEPREGFAEVYGSFPRTWKKAKGTFQVQGDTSAGKDCESGVVSWTARRV